MATHELKTWTSVFPAVVSRAKTLDLRFDDRGFRVGDTLALNEYDPTEQRYTGRRCTRQVTHVLRGGQFGLEPGYVALSLADSDGEREPATPVPSATEVARAAWRGFWPGTEPDGSPDVIVAALADHGLLTTDPPPPPSRRGGLLGAVHTVADLIETAGLGPVAAFEANPTLITVGVDADHSGKSQVLRRWLDHLNAVDLIMHTRRATSPDVRLNVRGLLDGVPTVAHTTYHRPTEPRQVEVITTLINTASPRELLDALCARDVQLAAQGIPGGRS